MTAATTPLLRTQGVAKSFGGVQALVDARLDVASGEIHTLLGENGAGKSTLVKILAGVLQPDAGTIWWDGEEQAELGIHQATRLGVRVIYQRLNTIPHMTVAQNLSLGREPARWGFIGARQERRDAEAALARLGISMDPTRIAGLLPVAERQLIEIARALQGRLRLLIMDEPTASLGEREVDRLFAVVRSLRDQGVAVVFISHKLEEVMVISDRVTVLRDGRTVGTVHPGETDRRHLVEMMVGRQIAQGLQLERAAPSSEVALEARDLWSETGLRGVSFSLRRGEVLGVYGLMGSGRTELARVLCGADATLSGSILLDGRPATLSSPADAKRLGIGFVPEERRQAAFEGLSVRENITSASGDLIAKLGFVRRAVDRALATQVVSALDVRTPSIDTLMRALSGGNQQKVLVGKWLARSPRVLILDDPTSGVDVGAKAEMYRLIAELTRGGVAVLMTSSELPELLEVANRILVLHRGRAVGELTGDGMTQRAVLELALGHAESAGPGPGPTAAVQGAA